MALVVFTAKVRHNAFGSGPYQDRWQAPNESPSSPLPPGSVRFAHVSAPGIGPPFPPPVPALNGSGSPTVQWTPNRAGRASELFSSAMIYRCAICIGKVYANVFTKHFIYFFLFFRSAAGTGNDRASYAEGVHIFYLCCISATGDNPPKTAANIYIFWILVQVFLVIAFPAYPSPWPSPP